VSCALYGLGDSSYEKFCYAGKMLGRRLAGLGAEMLGEPMWGDERAPNGYAVSLRISIKLTTRIEDTFVPWLQQTLDLMLPLLPTVEPDFSVRNALDVPSALYDIVPTSLNGALEKLRLHSNGTDAEAPPQSAPPRNVDEANGSELELLKPQDWTWTKLVKNTRITAENWWQDVREIELDLEDSEAAKYPPGSICSLQPRMSAKEDDFLELNGLTSGADDVFYLRPSEPGTPCSR
jgi:sulfite reductase alpha subunit-like flavoprotein